MPSPAQFPSISLEVASTLALSTTVTLLFLFAAYSKPSLEFCSLPLWYRYRYRRPFFRSSDLPRGSPKYIPPVSSRINHKISSFDKVAPQWRFMDQGGKVVTGRMFAYNPSFFLMASSPCSGLTFALGSLSYLGSPIAPKSTASESMHT